VSFYLLVMFYRYHCAIFPFSPPLHFSHVCSVLASLSFIPTLHITFLFLYHIILLDLVCLLSCSSFIVVVFLFSFINLPMHACNSLTLEISQTVRSKFTHARQRRRATATKTATKMRNLT